MPVTGRAATVADIPGIVAHSERHMLESGRDGDFIFSPFEEAQMRPLEVITEKFSESWAKPLTEVGWERCWIAADAKGEVRGDLQLFQRPLVKSALHHATLGMGLERALRGRGIGSEIMRQAIKWAKTQPTLAYLHLQVFAENTPALRLYEKFGFETVGRVPDMFRVHGRSVDDIMMILKL